jgi:hypothetical protein
VRVLEYTGLTAPSPKPADYQTGLTADTIRGQVGLPAEK